MAAGRDGITGFESGITGTSQGMSLGASQERVASQARVGGVIGPELGITFTSWGVTGKSLGHQGHELGGYKAPIGGQTVKAARPEGGRRFPMLDGRTVGVLTIQNPQPLYFRIYPMPSIGRSILGQTLYHNSITRLQDSFTPIHRLLASQCCPSSAASLASCRHRGSMDTWSCLRKPSGGHGPEPR